MLGEKEVAALTIRFGESCPGFKEDDRELWEGRFSEILRSLKDDFRDARVLPCVIMNY